jgi:hypothetical protein
LKGVEVIAKTAPLPIGEISVHKMGVMIEKTIDDPIAVENPTQEE